MLVAVAGARGVVGRHVVEHLRASEHDVVSLSRRDGVDVESGSGLEAALAGVSAIVDVLNCSSIRRAPATAFFEATSANLQRAAHTVGARHVVTLSIVGIDRASSYGYYAAKLRQEEVARQGEVPWSIVRATQFHEFAGQVMERSKVGQVAFVPSMPVCTVSARSLGALLADAATSAASEATIEVGGTEVANLLDLARRIVAQRQWNLKVLSVPALGKTGKEVTDGALLPGEGARRLGPSFEEWLHGEDCAALEL